MLSIGDVVKATRNVSVGGARRPEGTEFKVFKNKARDRWTRPYVIYYDDIPDAHWRTTFSDVSMTSLGLETTGPMIIEDWRL